MAEVLRTVVAVVFVGLLLLVLGTIVRFSIVSALRTRGAAGRLRQPDLQGVENLCGFRLPPELRDFYARSPLVGMSEFNLVDKRTAEPRTWFIGAFVPLTPVDVREARSISNAPGVPIADDGDKGVYYLTSSGTVRLQSPNLDEGDTLVAENIATFQGMTPSTEEAA